MSDQGGQFDAGLQATANLVQSLIGEVRDNSVALASFSAEMRNIRDNVNHLVKIVKDGNGRESVMTRLSLIEKSVETLEDNQRRDKEDIEEKLSKLQKDLEELKTSNEAARKDEAQERVATRGQKLQFWGTVILAILSLAAAAIGLLK